jgi:hypothetical protein
LEEYETLVEQNKGNIIQNGLKSFIFRIARKPIKRPYKNKSTIQLSFYRPVSSANPSKEPSPEPSVQIVDPTYKQTTLNLFKKYSTYMENPWKKYENFKKHQKTKSGEFHSKYVKNPKKEL